MRREAGKVLAKTKTKERLQKMRKFVGPTKKMMDALEKEGLNVTWPKTIKDGNDLAIEGMFYTGPDWEKGVLIDLRQEGELRTKADVDAAICRQLQEAYENFDIDEEMYLNLEGSPSERRARRVPGAVRLLEDLQEQESRLERFRDVAVAVQQNMIIPPKKEESKEGETVHITPEVANRICIYLKQAIPTLDNSGKSDCMKYIDMLQKKC